MSDCACARKIKPDITWLTNQPSIKRGAPFLWRITEIVSNGHNNQRLRDDWPVLLLFSRIRVNIYLLIYINIFSCKFKCKDYYQWRDKLLFSLHNKNLQTARAWSKPAVWLQSCVSSSHAVKMSLWWLDVLCVYWEFTSDGKPNRSLDAKRFGMT